MRPKFPDACNTAETIKIIACFSVPLLRTREPTVTVHMPLPEDQQRQVCQQSVTSHTAFTVNSHTAPCLHSITVQINFYSIAK